MYSSWGPNGRFLQCCHIRIPSCIYLCVYSVCRLTERLMNYQRLLCYLETVNRNEDIACV